LLGLAALAIDVVTLYMARAEAQRAADAGALAGAKILVDSGLTTDPCNTTLANAAQTLATNQATVVAAQNNIAGQPPTANITFPNGAGNTNCPNAFGIDPQVKVVVTRSGLPTFFARIWSHAPSTVQATAVAEAYNPSNSAGLSSTGSVTPIAPRCEKPMLLPNCDQKHAGVAGCGGSSSQFVDPATGTIKNPGLFSAGGIIGEQFNVTAACNSIKKNPACIPQGPAAGQYYPIALPSTTLYLCPSCSNSAGGFQHDLECCNTTALACGQQVPVDYSVNPNGNGGLTEIGGQCLIHQNPASGQDQTDTSTQSPMLFIAEDNNPFVGASVQVGDRILTSDSVVSIPLYDDTQIVGPPPSGSSVTIIGYLQVFINSVDNLGTMTVTVLNVSGCGNAASGTAIQGAATSVPVRLISTP
jgi:Flp pilus assembly protein TadG